MTEPRHAWRVRAGQTLERREWDGEAVLFNDLTGATHLLSATALWMLEQLCAAPADAAGLARALQVELTADGGEAEAEADAVEPAEVAALLHDLHQMHLIEPC